MTRRLVLFLLLSPLSVIAETGEEGLVPLSERMQDVYAVAKPNDFLIDPQRLLRGGEAKERREFLKYHASDSLIDLYVVIFKGEQLLFNPADLSGHHLNSRSDAKPAVMIHYYMGRPDRAELHLSPALQEVVPLAELKQAQESAVERAKAGVSPLDELEKFMVQTSIRIYRMENLLNEGTAGPAPLIPEDPMKQSANDAEHESLLKVAGELWAVWKFKLIAAVLVLAGGILLLRWLRLRATFEFPDADVEERLGGAHGAGVGAVIEFGKQSKPPAAQLEKLKLH